MFLNKIPATGVQYCKVCTLNYAKQTYDYLCENKYNLFYFYNVTSKTMSYVAICKNIKECYLRLAEPYLAFSISFEGKLNLLNYNISCPLVAYLTDRENGLTEEEKKKLYNEVYSINELVDGLSSEEAAKKIEDRKAFLDFLNKIDKVKEIKDEPTHTDKLGVSLSFRMDGEKISNHLNFSIMVLDNKKNYEIKDLYKFLNGFKQREEYSLATKRKIILEPMSFISPYDRVLPLLSSAVTFYKKAKTAEHYINYEKVLPVLDVLHDEVFDLNGKRTKIKEEDPASFYLDEKGVPHFTPMKVNDGNTKTLIGRNGIYVFDKKEYSISYYPFPNNDMKESYLYFDQVGVKDFNYIQDLFTEKLLPKLSASLKTKKTTKKEEKKPFEIALYLSIDEEKGLRFKTIYLENGEEVKEIESVLGQSMKTAYLSVLSSLGGLENGTLKKDEDIVSFLGKDLSSLLNLVTFYCDERLKPNKLIRSVSSFHVDMKKNGDYLSLTLDSNDYSKEELEGILRAYHQKKKYYLLKDNFLFLQGEELKEAADIFKDDRLETDNVPLYKLFSLNNIGITIDEDDNCKKVLSQIKEFKKHPLTIGNDIKADLRPYQVDGVKYLLSLHDYSFGGILADEMGLGKTLETITYINELKEEMPVLIITPKAVLYNWENEIHKFSSLTAVVIDTVKEEREKIIKHINKKKKVLYLISYDTFRRDEDLFSGIEFSTIVLDEAQSIKNAFSKRHQALLSLKAKNRIALTGTPLENSPFDLWSIFDFLMPGYLGSEKDFTALIQKEDSNKRLSVLLKPFMLRRRKQDVLKDLPSKTENNVLISMSESERMMYLAYLDKARAMQGENKISILSSLTRLRQLCVDPASFLENFDRSTKLLYTRELLKETISNGHKAIVFSSFKTALLDLEALMNEEDISVGVITGDTSGKDRMDLATDFNTKDDIKVLLVSLKAGGVGLNLVGADTVIHLDPWWNPQVENQASDRVHRIGQTHAVTILRLIMKDTIEEKVLNLQNIKKDMYNEIVEGNGGASSLSDDDIKYLLS